MVVTVKYIQNNEEHNPFIRYHCSETSQIIEICLNVDFKQSYHIADCDKKCGVKCLNVFYNEFL